MKTIFPQDCINSVFKRNQSLNDLLAPSSYPNNKVNRANSINSCNKCDICKSYLICSNYFTCSVTNRRYYTRGVLHCNCNNVIYLITCKNCLQQYVGSATNFNIILEYIKAISKPTKIDVGRQGILMVCVKMMFSSFCLLELLNKFVVMPLTLKKLYGTEKNIGKASYLPRVMA